MKRVKAILTAARLAHGFVGVTSMVETVLAV